MTRALMTGVSGLRAHQQQLDVVANNLANMNTIGYKSQKVAFSDLMYNTLRPASNATDNFGGTNPHQVGTGVLMSQITRHFNQGALQATGEVLDFAIQGSGFFVLAGPQGEQVFSRAGSFALDGDGNLVDPSTGYLVQRMGDHGEPTSEDFGFQVSGDQRIRVPLGAVVPGEETTQVDFFGNLPSDALPPLAAVLSSLAPFSTITGPATGTTRIDELTIHNDAYGPGDQIEINGTNPDGTPFSSSINAQNATMQDIVDAVNAELVGAVAELQPNGILTVTADETGEAFSSLIIQDAIGNVGGTDFSSNAMFVSTEGKSGDVFETTMEIFDQRGNDHAVQFSFEKEFINGWHVTATLTDGSSDGPEFETTTV